MIGSRGDSKLSLREKVMKSVQFDTNGGCWLYPAGACDYGTFLWRGTRYRAHRAMWEAVNGPIPDDLCICHKCDVRACCRPDHLFLGTKRENAEDMARKGRAARRFGVEQSSSKLTNEAVRDIRSSGARQVDLAKKYGVTQAMISLIITNQKWTHVK